MCAAGRGKKPKSEQIVKVGGVETWPRRPRARNGSFRNTFFSKKPKFRDLRDDDYRRSVHGGTRAAAAAEPAMHGPGYCYLPSRLQQPLRSQHVQGAQHHFLLR